MPNCYLIDMPSISVVNCKPPKSKQKGFTLIELLVVISIISLLVSILLPSLVQAKELARQTVCLSNARNIGLTLSMYVEDYGGYLPPTLWLNKNNGGMGAGKYWNNILVEDGYVDLQHDDFDNWGWGNAATPYAPGQAGIFSCPNDGQISYFQAINELYGPYADEPFNVSLAKQPSEEGLCGDGKAGNAPLVFDRNWLVPRHPSGANLLFRDNHLETWEELEYRDPDTLLFFGF